MSHWSIVGDHPLTRRLVPFLQWKQDCDCPVKCSKPPRPACVGPGIVCDLENQPAVFYSETLRAKGLTSTIPTPEETEVAPRRSSADPQPGPPPTGWHPAVRPAVYGGRLADFPVAGPLAPELRARSSFNLVALILALVLLL